MKYKVIDLFAGVGGMSLGFEMAGFDVVLANEYDKDIATAYKKNHSSTKMINEDITKLDLQSVFEQYKGNIDVIIGGSAMFRVFRRKEREKQYMMNVISCLNITLKWWI